MLGLAFHAHSRNYLYDESFTQILTTTLGSGLVGSLAHSGVAFPGVLPSGVDSEEPDEFEEKAQSNVSISQSG